jgi:hypothetical protein
MNTKQWKAVLLALRSEATLDRFCDLETFTSKVDISTRLITGKPGVAILTFTWDKAGSLLLKVLNGYGQIERSVRIESASFDKQAKRLKGCFPDIEINASNL